jgi:hypothetical protein
MLGGKAERRRFPRLERSLPPRVRGDPWPRQPVVINASTGGVRLWMPDPPSMHSRHVVCWPGHGRQQVIGLRPVWLQPSAAAPDKPGEPCTSLPQDIPADPQVTIEFLLEDRPSRKTDPTSPANRWTLLSKGRRSWAGRRMLVGTGLLAAVIGWMALTKRL